MDKKYQPLFRWPSIEEATADLMSMLKTTQREFPTQKSYTASVRIEAEGVVVTYSISTEGA